MRAAMAVRQVPLRPPATCGAREQVYRSHVTSSNSVKFFRPYCRAQAQRDDATIPAPTRAVVSNFCESVNRAFSSRKYARGTYPRARAAGPSTLEGGARCNGSAVAPLRFRRSVEPALMAFLLFLR